jgi:GH15 family glucan-1,4-alpha-glucosidase
LWLWALADHVRRGGHLDPTLEQAARLVVRCLLGAGELPCFDCWEEHPGNLHTASLAAVSAGLREAGALLGDGAAAAHAEKLRARLLGPEHTLAGGFIRCPGDTRVDGSLLWLGVPLGVVAVDDARYTTTLSRIAGRVAGAVVRPSRGWPWSCRGAWRGGTA